MYQTRRGQIGRLLSGYTIHQPLKSIEDLSKIYRTSIENLSKIYRTSIENLSKIYRKFAGPLAQGVLDPVISHFPSAVLVLWFFLDHPRGPGSQKCDPWWLLGGSSVAPRWLLGGSLVDFRCGSRLCFYCCGSGKTAFGRARTDQGPQLAHYIRHLYASAFKFGLRGLIFVDVSPFGHMFDKCSIDFR